MSEAAASIFESFNARTLNTDQVAATFVPSQQFARLCKRCHTIIVGPRGSGKTTLLKMLQVRALSKWAHSEADHFINRVDFTGVFVASDISWGAQLAALGKDQVDEATRRTLSIASFTTHVLRSLITAMQERVHPGTDVRRVFRQVTLSNTEESAVSTRIARSWYLPDVVPTFIGLKQALTHRLSLIRELANKEALLGPDGRKERLAALDLLHLHFLQAVGTAIEVFDDGAGLINEKWALLFDELEIAPDWIQEELLRSLRSTNERILFKLALNPFNRRSEELLGLASGPAPGQDFDQLALWYAEKREAYHFCKKLWDEMVRERTLPPTPPRKALGLSKFESYSEDWRRFGTAYRPGSRWSRLFVALAAKDATFKRYLVSKGIDPNALHKLQGSERAAEIRKIAPVVAVRDFYRQKDEVGEQNVHLRSRKRATLFAGAESLFAVTEGNPRWFIGLVSLLLDTAVEFGNGGIEIRAAKQAEEMRRVAQRFAATLRTIPLASDVSNRFNVLTLVRKVARYFYAQAVEGEFKPEPAGSFTVDSKTPDDLLLVLSQAVNAGAIVYVPDDEGQLIMTSLRGKRFRVSYLLAPLYGFPIRLGKSTSLSSVLSWDASTANASQPLPFEEL